MALDETALRTLAGDAEATRALRPRRRRWKRWALMGALVVIAAALFIVRGRQPLELATATVQALPANAPAAAVLDASGFVVARRQATVSSKVTGKVVEVLIEEGMKVQEGQILARLDDSNIAVALHLAQAQLASAKASLGETEASLDQTTKEFKRISDLSASHIANQSDLDKAEADMKTMRARLERQRVDVTVAERQVDTWQQQIDDMIIRAPFTGITVSKNAQPGEMISPISAGGGFTRTGIGTIVDMSSLEIEVDVNESYLNRVEPRQEVEATLDAYPDWKIPSKVIAIIPTADRQKATVKVRVGFNQLDPRILPEMGVKVAFHGGAPEPTSTGRSMVVPKSAVRQVDGQDIVWVVQDGKVERRAVSLASGTGDQTVIRAGLAAGERIIVEGPPTLKAGDHVRETSK